MIEQIVKRITLATIRQGVLEEKDIPIIRYGLQVMLEISIIVVTILMVSIALDRVIESAAWMGTVIIMRSYGGGYHAKSFKQCYFISVVVFVLNVLMIDFLSDNLLLSSAVCSMVTICLFMYSIVTEKKAAAKRSERLSLHKVSKKINAFYSIVIVVMFILEIVSTAILASMLGFMVSQLSILINKE